MKSGYFITFEGGEGTGKTTQIERVRAQLENLGIEVVVTREPGGTPLAEQIRGCLLNNSDEPMAATTEFLVRPTYRLRIVTDLFPYRITLWRS